MTIHGPLAARIRRELSDLEKLVPRVATFMDKMRKTGDDAYLDAAALNLHGFYTAVERIFKDIAKNIDGGLPSGSEWHKQLLLQMSADIPEVRPPVIRLETRDCLHEYLSFRHVVRNVYTFSFRPSRIAELADELRACHESVKNDLRGFARFLEQLDQCSS